MNSPIIRKQFRSTALTLTIVELSNAVSCMIDGLITSIFLGSEAMAAVGLASLYFSICAIISCTLSASSQGLCSFYLAKGDQKGCDRVFSTVVTLVLVIGGAITVLGLALAGPLAALLGARGDSAALQPLTSAYFRGVFLGTIPNILLAVLSPLVQMDGNAKAVRLTSVLVFFGDGILDLANVFFFRWGLFGMGFATSLGFYIAIIPIVLHFTRHTTLFRFRVKDAALSQSAAIFTKGLPRGAIMLARSLGPVFLNLYVLAVLGTTGMTAMSVQNSVRYLLMSPVWGIGSTVLMMAGLFVEERDLMCISQTIREAVQSILLAIIPLTVVLALASPYIALAFLPRTDPAYGSTVIAVLCYVISLPLIGINFILSGYLQAIGKSVETTVHNILNEFVGLLAVTLLFGSIFGPDRIWYALPVWQLLLMGLYILYVTLRKPRGQTFRRGLLLLPDDFAASDKNCLVASVGSLEEAEQFSAHMQQVCARWGVDRKRAFHLSLCAEELMSNVITYGFDDGKEHHLEIRVVSEGDVLTLHLRDDCPKFDFKSYMDMCRFDPEHPETNMGVRIVMALATDITYSNTLKTNNLLIKLS